MTFTQSSGMWDEMWEQQRDNIGVQNSKNKARECLMPCVLVTGVA